MSVGDTILEQLGGRMFTLLTGAKNLHAGANLLSMRLGKGPNGITHVTIVLNAYDTYDIQYLSIVGTRPPIIKAESKGVYCDQLKEDFERHTGLLVRL